jgi:hypothetical protein
VAPLGDLVLAHFFRLGVAADLPASKPYVIRRMPLYLPFASLDLCQSYDESDNLTDFDLPSFLHSVGSLPYFASLLVLFALQSVQRSLRLQNLLHKVLFRAPYLP